MYATIRIRGTVNVTPNIKKALDMMNLKRANNMSLWKEDKVVLGMINKVKDYVAFGKITEEMLEEVIAKKAKPTKPGQEINVKKAIGELKKGKTLKEAGVKNCFRLNPPRGGFERKGIKVPYKLGGALGNRGEAINELIKRML